MDNKQVFATNLKRLMLDQHKSRKDVADVLGISYFTVSDWVNGKKYPRMDKVELLAKYFGVLKSELIEEVGYDAPSIAELSPMTEGEQMLLDLFRKVPDEKQKMVLQMIKIALNT